MAVSLRRDDRVSVGEIVPALDELYAEVYAEPPYHEGLEEVRAFQDRLADHRHEPGFRLASMWQGDQLIGFLYGFRLEVDAPLWDSLLIRSAGERAESPPLQLTAYVSELLVRAGFRRQGVARRLHDAFMSERPESQVALLAHPEAGPAQAAYAAWGWKRVGYGRPFPGGSEYETLMLFL
ncbi:GNAT family N-acetyltransferase [Plantactinospora sp. CA-294935]|uniref:GNAT family N-acetyltransferase n=1 Tax=Plantactinospora sp. CA-294935 TaxID=3240012 RepID=UPI003D8BEA2A